MTTYRIEIWDVGEERWVDAPGESSGWTLDDAEAAVAAGLYGLDGTLIDPDDVRIVARDAEAE